MDLTYQAKRESLNQDIGHAARAGNTTLADGLKAEEERLSTVHATRMRAFLSKDPMSGVIGAFEGAGYATKGLYRPTLDCLMFSRARQPFCPVCRRAVENMVRRYVDSQTEPGDRPQP